MIAQAILFFDVLSLFTYHFITYSPLQMEEGPSRQMGGRSLR